MNVKPCGYLPLLAVFPALLAGPRAQAKEKAMALPELVQLSALIARVKILETRELKGPEYQRYRSIATAKVLEVYHGEVKEESIQLRFDNGCACPNVHYQLGEECLIFAAIDIDGTWSTVNNEYGKKAIHPKSLGSLIQEVQELSTQQDFKVALSAETEPAEDGPPGGRGGLVSLKVAITNTGTRPLKIINRLEKEFRGKDMEKMLERLLPRYGLLVTLIFKPESKIAFAEKQKELDASLLPQPLLLEPSEGCEALIPSKELNDITAGSGKATLQVWARAGGRLSEPVTVTVDLGEGVRKLLEREVQRPGEKAAPPPPGPFRKLAAKPLGHEALPGPGEKK
ncbi:MAG: hypothetical protein HY717_15255 [Planctomycetes bacterium]|nr:hypothetical protein [Planctomycetota bacterium]